MNKRIKKLWVDALRSNEYEQGSGRLRDANNNFCCLGVLCNIYAQEHPEVAARQKYSLKFMGQEAYLPGTVFKWAGISHDMSTGSKFTGYDIMIDDYQLSSYNDEGASFEEIAELIERNL